MITTHQRCPRKDRDTAFRLILEYLGSYSELRLTPAQIAAQLGLGRERTAGLLAVLLSRGEVVRDGRYWMLPPSKPDLLLLDGEIDRPPTHDVRAWLMLGREIFGCAIRVTVEVGG